MTDAVLVYRDRFLRILEAAVLAPLTVLFVGGLAYYPLVRLQVAQREFWLSLLGTWGLASLWWLVIAVSPAARRLPAAVWPGLAAGVLTVAAFLLMATLGPPGRSGLVGLAFFYAIWLVPVAILAERLAAYRRYRRGIATARP